MKRDTEWPRYQVFIQERVNKPFEDVGSVHAPDFELALQNARDVFVRRPECLSLRVVPSDAIYARTEEQIEEEGLEESLTTTGEEAYHVFCKSQSAGTHVLLGQVEAPSPAEALRIGRERFVGEVTRGRQKPFSWWVLPAKTVVESDPEDIESLFAPARSKHFRMPAEFKTQTAMREIREDKSGSE